jgi:hypothetical protein
VGGYGIENIWGRIDSDQVQRWTASFQQTFKHAIPTSHAHNYNIAFVEFTRFQDLPYERYQIFQRPVRMFPNGSGNPVLLDGNNRHLDIYDR